MAKMGAKQTEIHKAFLALKRPFDPTAVYMAMCKLQKLGEDAIERGIGKLFKDGDLKPPQDRPRKKKKREGGGGDGF